MIISWTKDRSGKGSKEYGVRKFCNFKLDDQGGAHLENVKTEQRCKRVMKQIMRKYRKTIFQAKKTPQDA